MDSIKELNRARPFLFISGPKPRTGFNECRGNVMVENSARNTLTLRFLGILALILFQACAPKPFQVKLNPHLGQEAVNEISVNQPCPKSYRLALDAKASTFEVTTRPENCCYPGLSLDWIFPIGKTLSAYLTEAQKGQTGETIPLQLDMSDFRFVMDARAVERPYVDSLKYKAHFTGPAPIGFFTLSESSYGSMPITGEEEKMYDAVSDALQSTTIKLFAEVASRMCGG